MDLNARGVMYEVVLIGEAGGVNSGVCARL